MRRWFLLIALVLLTVGLTLVHAQNYTVQGTVSMAPSGSKLTAVDPMIYAVNTDVIPARPFLYTVDKSGITITRFNDNAYVGYWSWPKPPQLIYTILPNGSFTGLNPPAEWEPVAMTVSYPTLTDLANRGMTGTTVAKPIPDLTPPPTLVYVVMRHSGYQWQSASGLRDTIVPSTTLDTDSAMLIQIDVSDPSFSTAFDASAPADPPLAAALLGHGAGQPVYDRATGNVYVGNLPSNSLPANLASFVSVVGRIPDTVTAPEREVPGINIPVIRCGPQHPEGGIPVSRPQAWACYDPSGVHLINDNEHAGAAGNFDWQFRALPDWLHVANALACPTGVPADVTCSKDGILYGTPLTVGEWFAEAKVHNLDDEYGAWSYWSPVQLLVTPTAEYLPIRAQFAAGVPVAYPLEGTGDCTLAGAPAWVNAVQVPNGCVVMGRAPLDGEHYNFTMPGFTPVPVAGYPNNSLIFSGNVFGGYGFVPLPSGVAISGLAWHQISKVADGSTETPVLTAEYIGADPGTGQLYQILLPPGKPQPPNERPPETALTVEVVSAEGAPLSVAGAVRFGQVAVEADRDIFVAAETNTPEGGALVKVSGGASSVIPLPGLQPSFLDLDSDLRTAILGVEPGQVDHNVLWVTGSGNAAVVDTASGNILQTFPVANAGSVAVDFGTQFAYVSADSSTGSVTVFGPSGSARPPMRPRIWSYEEASYNLNETAQVPFKMMATGDGLPTLTLVGDLPAGITFTDLGGGFAQLTGTPTVGGEFGLALVATGSSGTYAQAFGVTVYEPPAITSGNTATFVVGSASAFMVTLEPDTALAYTWDQDLLPPGVQLLDNENGTASIIGTPEVTGTYQFRIGASTGYPIDAEQLFTLIVEPAGTKPPVITSPNTFTWDAAGAPYSPDPFTVSSIGSPTPTLSIVSGSLPPTVTFVDNGNSTATFGGACRIPFAGWTAECLGFLPANAVGTWTFTIRAHNSVGDDYQTFTLNVAGDPTILNATPATLEFVTDGSFAPSVPVSLTTGSLGTGGVTLPYAVVSTATWLSATPVAGMTGGAPITVSANAAGLAPGTYTGTIIINSAGTEGPPATVAVTLTVPPEAQSGMVGIWPGALNFSYQVGGALPTPETVWVLSGGSFMPYTVSANGAKWLSAPASGIAPGGFSVSVDPRVGSGMHIANLMIAGDGALNGPQNIPVTFFKTAGETDLMQVTFDVGGSPEGLALNSTTHNLFITSSNAAAEAGSEAAAESGAAETEVPGPAEPSTVFQIDPTNKTVVGEAVVHSEGEYAAVNSKTGLVYHASQGTGEVAVIDGTTNTAVTFIPLTGTSFDGLREGAFQPYQIAIDEAQNIIYVGAKAPPIVDPPSPMAGCMAIHEMPDDEYDCWNPGKVFVIDGKTNQVVGSFFAGDDPEGVVFAKATGKVYASNEDDGSITVAKGAKRTSTGITLPTVIGTIIKGKLVAGWWKPTCDGNNYCGERGQAALWPKLSACNGKDDEAEEADKMAVDPDGNVYIIDDRYRVAKINGKTDTVANVLEIPGYDCELEVPDGSEVLFKNTANNIAFMAGKKKLYVTSEQNTVSLIDPDLMTIKATITIPGAVELDAITTDPGLNKVFITDEGQAALWILKGACANGTSFRCVLEPK